MPASPRRSLLVLSAGEAGTPYVTQAVEKFSPEQFDILIFAHDNTPFDQFRRSNVRVVHNPHGEPMRKFDFAKEYLKPISCAPYEYVFLWDDDLELAAFDPVVYLEIVRRYGLALSQPALAPGSHYSHDITLQVPGGEGRYTDFVEVMAMVFTADAWTRFYQFLEEYDLPFPNGGGGYDYLAFFYCNYARMGIIDRVPVLHTKPVHNWKNRQLRICQLFRQHYHFSPVAQKINLAQLGELSEAEVEALHLDYRFAMTMVRQAALMLEPYLPPLKPLPDPLP